MGVTSFSEITCDFHFQMLLQTERELLAKLAIHAFATQWKIVCGHTFVCALIRIIHFMDVE
jgi:hypothetical protein